MNSNKVCFESVFEKPVKFNFNHKNKVSYVTPSKQYFWELLKPSFLKVKNIS